MIGGGRVQIHCLSAALKFRQRAIRAGEMEWAGLAADP